MSQNKLKEEIQQMNHWWHKLIFLCSRNENMNLSIPLLNEMNKVNVNKVLSEKLLHISKSKYPLHVEDMLQDVFKDTNQMYLLCHIDILFDPVLQIHPVRLLENISKSYKIIVEWPGRYKDNQLYYAEYGHPEYFSCRDFEGKVMFI